MVGPDVWSRSLGIKLNQLALALALALAFSIDGLPELPVARLGSFNPHERWREYSSPRQTTLEGSRDEKAKTPRFEVLDDIRIILPITSESRLPMFEFRIMRVGTFPTLPQSSDHAIPNSPTSRFAITSFKAALMSDSPSSTIIPTSPSEGPIMESVQSPSDDATECQTDCIDTASGS